MIAHLKKSKLGSGCCLELIIVQIKYMAIQQSSNAIELYCLIVYLYCFYVGFLTANRRQRRWNNIKTIWSKNYSYRAKYAKKYVSESIFQMRTGFCSFFKYLQIYPPHSRSIAIVFRKFKMSQRLEWTSEDKPSMELHCKICLEGAAESTGRGSLISPCKCDGSMKFVHEKCIKRWVFQRFSEGSREVTCEICHDSFLIEIEFQKKFVWEKFRRQGWIDGLMLVLGIIAILILAKSIAFLSSSPQFSNYASFGGSKGTAKILILALITIVCLILLVGVVLAYIVYKNLKRSCTVYVITWKLIEKCAVGRDHRSKNRKHRHNFSILAQLRLLCNSADQQVMLAQLNFDATVDFEEPFSELEFFEVDAESIPNFVLTTQ